MRPLSNRRRHSASVGVRAHLWGFGRRSPRMGTVASRASQAAGLGNGQDPGPQATHLPPQVARPCCAGGWGASSVQTRDVEGMDGHSPRDACHLAVPRDFRAPSNPAWFLVTLQRPTSPKT